MSNTYDDIMKRREKETFDAGFEAGSDSSMSHLEQIRKRAEERDLVDRSEALVDGQSAAITSSYDYILQLEATIEKLKSYQANYEHATQIERAEAENNRTKLEDALKTLIIETPTTLRCEDFHHYPGDRHGYAEACPPKLRHLAALEQAWAALNKGKE